MEQKAPRKLSMVSRLPKYGSRPASGLSSQPNGTVPAQHAHDGRRISGKSSGVVEHLSFSIKWTKESGSSASPQNQVVSGEKRETHAVHSPGTQANKKLPNPTRTGRKPASSVLAESPRSAVRSSKSTSGPTISQTTPASSTSSCSSSSKLTQNRTGGRSPKLQRLQYNPSSRDGLPQSNRGLKKPSADRMVRSQSFTYFRQPSPANSTLSRSFSFNKAVELAKPLPNTQLCPVRTPGLKPPQGLSSRLKSLGFGKSFPVCSSTVASPAECSAPGTGLKKPSLPNCALSKPPMLGNRRTRSRHSLEMEGSQEENLIKIFPLTPESNQDTSKFEERTAPGDFPDGTDEMSFLSGSTHRNDLLEDFDHLSDQPHSGVPDIKRLATPTQTSLHNFLHADWVGLTDVDSLGSSSLELSPSSSSGGTYMWDEEMSYTHTNCCDDESDLHTADALNNLGNVDVFDLKEKDLLLKLPKDGTLHNGETGNWEHSDKRTQQMDNRTKQYNQNRLLILQGLNGHPAIQSEDQMVTVGRLSLIQMLQDFSSVKSQLLKLKFLLQVEDDEIYSKQSTERNSAAPQVEVLRKEVMTLRETLRNKDNIISQLTKQQQQQHQLLQWSLSGLQVKESKENTCQKADKSTQTHRSPHSTVGLSLWSNPSTTSLQHPPAQQALNSGTISKFNHHWGPQ